MRARKASPWRLVRDRQPQAHRRAAAVGALGDHRAAVRLRDLPHDRQAEARARQAPGGRARGRSGRTRTAGRSSRCPGRGRARSPPRRAPAPRSDRPSGLHLAALSSRFVTARSRRPGTPATRHGSSSVKNTLSAAWRRARSTASATSVSSRTSSTPDSRLVAAGEVDEVGDQHRQLVELHDQVAAAGGRGPRGREHASRPAPRCSCAGS